MNYGTFGDCRIWGAASLARTRECGTEFKHTVLSAYFAWGPRLYPRAVYLPRGIAIAMRALSLLLAALSCSPVAAAAAPSLTGAAVAPHGGDPGFGEVLHQQLLSCGGPLGKVATTRPPSTAGPQRTRRPLAPAARPAGGREILIASVAGFGLVGATSLSLTTSRALLGGAGLGAALAEGARVGQRWGRVSAAFGGGRAAARWAGASEGLASVLAAAAAGAVGSRSPAEVPARVGAFVALAVGIEAGAPRALGRCAGALRRAAEVELAARRALFARPPAARPPERPPPKPVGGAGGTGSAVGGAAVAPWRRVQRWVDSLNAELGHAPPPGGRGQM